MDMYGWQRSKFGLFGNGFVHLHLGQASAAELEGRSAEAIARYQALVKRASLLRDDAVRQEILSWIGNGKIPGSPSDRFRHVKDDMDQAAPWDEIRTGHLEDLEAVNAELETHVAEGEKSGVYGAGGPLSLVDERGKLTSVGAGLVVLAAIGLVVVPLTLK